MKTHFLELIFPKAIDNKDPHYIFQSHIAFMLSIPAAAFTSLFVDQNNLQASEETI